MKAKDSIIKEDLKDKDTAKRSGVNILKAAVLGKKEEAVNTAMEKIEKLRKEGEYADADNVLNTVQAFLSELQSLEAWAIENRMTINEFEKKAFEWEKACGNAIKASYKTTYTEPGIK